MNTRPFFRSTNLLRWIINLLLLPTSTTSATSNARLSLVCTESVRCRVSFASNIDDGLRRATRRDITPNTVQKI